MASEKFQRLFQKFCIISEMKKMFQKIIIITNVSCFINLNSRPCVYIADRTG